MIKRNRDRVVLDLRRMTHDNHASVLGGEHDEDPRGNYKNISSLIFQVTSDKITFSGTAMN